MIVMEGAIVQFELVEAARVECKELAAILVSISSVLDSHKCGKAVDRATARDLLALELGIRAAVAERQKRSREVQSPDDRRFAAPLRER